MITFLLYANYPDMSGWFSLMTVLQDLALIQFVFDNKKIVKIGS